MKKWIIVVLLTMLSSYATFTYAALIDNGCGLIYDADLNITWYDTPSTSFGGGNWDAAMTWVAGLKVGGVSGWRLPTTPGGTYPEYLGEMGHLYYDELKNVAGGPLTNLGPFINLQGCDYWTGTEYDQNSAWDFYFHVGGGGITTKNNTERALAVHEGNVHPVPIPGAVWLFGSGLIGLIGIRQKF